jgi:hypothetical protein
MVVVDIPSVSIHPSNMPASHYRVRWWGRDKCIAN